MASHCCVLQIDPTEFEIALARFIVDIRRSMENPSALAHGALMRQMFQPSQPNYAFTPEARLEAVERLTVDDVTQFYAAHAGRREFTMAVAGDVGDRKSTRLDSSHVAISY